MLVSFFLIILIIEVSYFMHSRYCCARYTALYRIFTLRFNVFNKRMNDYGKTKVFSMTRNVAIIYEIKERNWVKVVSLAFQKGHSPQYFFNYVSLIQHTYWSKLLLRSSIRQISMFTILCVFT